MAIGTLIVANVTLWLLSAKWGQRVIEFLLSTRQALLCLKWFVGVVLVGLLAAMIDFVGFRAILFGAGTTVDVVLVAMIATFGSVYAWGLVLEWQTEGSAIAVAEQAAKEAAAERLVRERESEQRAAIQMRSRRMMGILSEKWKRLAKALKNSTVEDVLAKGIDSQAQVAQLLRSLHEFVRLHFNGGLSELDKLRVAYFEPDGNRLVVVGSFDGVHAECIQTPNREHANRFILDQKVADGCLAVHASLNGNSDPIMIPDADEANRNPSLPYKHFSINQEETIKSIAAFPCPRGDDQRTPHPVVTLDTDAVGYFGNEPNIAHELRSIIEPFALQVLFERDIDRLVDRLRSSIDQNQATLVEDANGTVANGLKASEGT